MTDYKREYSKFKTREEIAMEYGIHRRTLYRRLKQVSINFSQKLLSVKEQEIIYSALGIPEKQQNR